MKKGIILTIVVAMLASVVCGSDKASERAHRMGPGMNLSFLENFWQGTESRHYSDFVRKEDMEAAERRLADIRAAGFRTVRIPINFSAWASMEAPFEWESEELVKQADRVIGWALEAGLNVIIDHHHPELGDRFAPAVTTERMVVLWKRIAERYRHLDPERVFFELRNEPKDIEAAVWRLQAEELIRTVQKAAPDHTIIVGFHDWNSRDALVSSEPFEFENVIYTFHYYHPFMFTHMGATWVAPGISDLRDIAFPGTPGKVPEIPEKGKGTWVESQLRSYGSDANLKYIDSQIKEAREWSVKHGAPVFLGEFGSLGTYSSEQDRCRHAKAVYEALGKYRIPSAWWEWFAGFNFLDEQGRKPRPCFADAIAVYAGALKAG